MRFRAFWWILALLAGPAAGGAASLEGPAAAGLPQPVREALSALAEAVERGDRAALSALLQPDSRPSAAPLLGRLAPGPASVRTEVELLVAGAGPSPGGGARGRLILSARVRPAPAEPARAEAGLTPEDGLAAWALSFSADSEGRLVLEEGSPASIVAADLDWRLDRVPSPEAPGTITVRSRLDFVPEAPGLVALLLDLPPKTSTVELLPRGAAATGRWLRAKGEGDGGRLLVALEAPAQAGFRLLVGHEGEVAPQGMAGDSTLYLPHGAMITAWSTDRYHRWAVTLDLPAELRGVSIGPATELEAEPGRRRVRYATERAIDYPSLAVGHFTVDRDGPLELWRTARVGGDPKKLLGELRELVAFHESRVAPLPYGAFRLVELDMGGAAAVSYASAIAMKTSVVAQDKQRFAILAHEVAHQWWGNAVQGDQHTRWISEGMANALMDLFVAHREGPEAMQDLLDEHRDRTLQALGAGARPLADVTGRPADFYERGALFVHALRAAVGDETFWAILRAWYAEHSGPGAGTPELRATAERVAGRSLAEVFEPWLESTALPVLRLDWEPDATGATLTIEQDAPHFLLEVPVEALLAGGRSETKLFPVGGARTEASWELGERPLALRLDPEGLTPRVRDDELVRYLEGEAEACLARGESERGLALLERLEREESLVLPAGLEVRRTRALREQGREVPASAEQAVGVLSAAERQAILLEDADELLTQGRAESALPLLEELAATVEDGAAVQLRLGRVYRALGREAEAEAAFRKALDARPDNAGARLALGLPAAPEKEDGQVFLIEKEDRRLDGNRPKTTRLLAASGGRWGLALAGSRRIWTGRDSELEAVPDFRPSGLIDAVVVDADSPRALVVALEGGRRRGRLTVIELDEQGRGRVVARHDRTPGAAIDLASDGREVHLAFLARDGARQWYRFLPDLRGPSSEGPDDLDGLRTLQPGGDERFEPSGRTPANLRPVLLGDGSFAWLNALDALESADGVLWEELEEQGRWTAVDLRRAGDGVGLLFGGDASRSPFAEDSLRRSRLVIVGPERLDERELPEDALQAVEAPDGSLLVLRGREGCSGVELQVVRLPPS